MIWNERYPRMKNGRTVVFLFFFFWLNESLVDLMSWKHWTVSHDFLAEGASLHTEYLSHALCRCLSFCALLAFPLQGLVALLTAKALALAVLVYREVLGLNLYACLNEMLKMGRKNRDKVFSPTELWAEPLLALPRWLRPSHGTSITLAQLAFP